MTKHIKVLIDCNHLEEPKEKLTIGVSRRALFSAFSEDLHAQKHAANGIPAFKIQDLPEMTVSEMAQIRPVLSTGSRVHLRDGYVWGTSRASSEDFALFAVDSAALCIFNQFNGRHSISEIVTKTAQINGWSEDRSFRTVRLVFFKLCEARICEPG